MVAWSESVMKYVLVGISTGIRLQEFNDRKEAYRFCHDMNGDLIGHIDYMIIEEKE
jgi:hypothetical protein